MKTTKALTDATGLEYVFTEAGQFDVAESFDDTEEPDYDLRDRILLNLREPIGNIFLRFSILEHDVEICISNLFSDRSSHMGMQVNKFLEYSQKTNMLNEMLLSHINLNSRKEFKVDVRELAKQLDKVGNLRNIIAHAKWFTLTKDGFVRSQVKLDKVSGLMKIKYYKIDKDALDYIELEIQAAEIMLSELQYKLDLV